MQKIVFYIGGGIIIVIGIIIFLMYVASQNTHDVVDKNEGNTKINVATTIFPLYDITRRIAGDTADVQLLLPPGASPHFYEFTPQQINNIKNTDVAFVIGHGADDWARDAFTTSNADIVSVDDGIKLRTSMHVKHNHDGDHEEDHDGDHDGEVHEEAHEEEPEEDHDGEVHEEDHDGEVHEEEHEGSHEENIDPHYWLSPNNAILIAQTVADTLAQKDSNNALIYQQNAQNFIDELTEVNSELQSQIQQLSCKDMIVLHGAWYYFAQHFGFDIAGVFMPETGATPSPRYLTQLKTATEESCANVIFSEPQLSTQSIDTFAHDNKLTIPVIDPIGGVTGRDTYIDLMVYNVKTIIDGLKNNDK